MAAYDIVVAPEAARFQFSEVRLGLAPAMISPFCIARLGVVAARRLFLTGERLSAAEALRLGLVDVVADDLDAAFGRIVQDLASGGPEALIAIKKLVADVRDLDGKEALDYTSRMIAELREGEEAQEGMAAFLAKRPAAWGPSEKS